MVLATIGENIGIGVDKLQAIGKQPQPNQHCSTNQIFEEFKEENFTLKKIQYKGYGSIIGIVIDIPIGIAIAISEPVNGLKIIGGIFYIWFSGLTLAAMNMDSHPRLFSPEKNSWLPENYRNCKNSSEYFISVQGTNISLQKDLNLEDKKKICQQEIKKLTDKAYFSFIEANFDKPDKKISQNFKKNLIPSEIFPYKENLDIFHAKDGIKLTCAYKIIFYYKGGKENFRKDFSNNSTLKKF